MTVFQASVQGEAVRCSNGLLGEEDGAYGVFQVIVSKLRAGPLAETDFPDNIAVTTVSESPAHALYHNIKHLYGPALGKGRQSGGGERVARILQELQEGLSSTFDAAPAPGGAAARQKVQSLEDEYRHWVAEAEDSFKDPDWCDCAREVCGLLEPISRPFFKGREGAEIRLSGMGEEEVVALIDEIEDALNGLWSVAHRGEWVYAEARMTSLLEVLGTAFQGYIQKKLRARDLWRAGFKGVEDALQVGIQILHRWNQMVALLTKLEWIGGNHAHVYGGAYDTAALDAFRGRLEEILSIRLAHEEMKRLLSEQELTALLAGDAFQPFDQINSLLVSKFQEPLWKAAKDEYGRRMGSTEARTSQKLKETLSGVILPAMSAAVAEYASAGTGAVAQPYQAFQQLDRYTKLLENPNVARALQAEIDAVLRCFEGYLDGVRTDFERRAHQGPGRGGGSGASIVQEMEWVIQADRKVTHTMKLFRGLRDSRTGGGLQGLCDDLTKDMRAHKGALFQRWQARTEESLHEIRIEKRGKLMDLDSQHGHIKLHYNDELVALLKEVRQLAALGFDLPPEIERETATAQKFYRYGMVLKQVANFYNDLATKIIPCQKPMLLEDAIEFEKVLTNPRDGMGKIITWDNPNALEGYVNRLQGVAHRLTERNRQLRKWHRILAGKVCGLMETDLVRHKDRWAKGIKEIRGVFFDLERQFPKDAQGTWRLHWDFQIYKALKCQYQHGLEFLNETLPAIEVKLVFKHKKLQFEPALEDIHAQYYKAIKQFISIPQVFKGVSAASERAGFFADITASNVGSLGKVYERAESLFQKLQDEQKKVQDWVALGMFDLEELIDRHLDEVADWELNFKALKLCLRDSEKIPAEVKVDCFTVSLLPVKGTVDDLLKKLQEALVASLRRKAVAEKEEIEGYMHEGRSILEGNAASVEEIGRARQNAKSLIGNVMYMQNLRRKIEEKNKLLRVVGAGAGAGAPAAVDISFLRNEWDSFTQKLQQHESHLEEQKDSLKAEIDKQVTAFTHKVDSFGSRWRELKPRGVQSGDLQLIISRLDDDARTLEDLLQEAGKFRQDYEHFSVEPPEFAALEELQRDIEATRQSWERYTGFTSSRDEFAARDWLSIRGKMYDFEDFLAEWGEKVKGTAAKDPVALVILKELESYRKVMPMMRFLRGDGWDRAHWAQLFQILGFPAKGPDAVQVDNLALSHFLGKAAAILEKTEEIKALHAQAQGEVTIKEAIQQLEVWGYDRQFALLLHEFPDGRRHVALIKEWKEIMTEIADNQSLIQSLKESPFAVAFKADIALWEGRLLALAATLADLNYIQRKWVYLEPIFARGALPGEQARFRRVDDEFRQLMSTVEGNPLVVSFADMAGLQKSLPQMVTQLDICQKALADFLEEKRSLFPRFYFIGDDDLLEILGQSKNPEVIQSHLKKLFAGIHSVVFAGDGEGRQITAMKSAAGEVVPLGQPVAVTEDVEQWLADLSDAMVGTLRRLLLQCLEMKDYAKFPSQILSLADTVHFTQSCESAIVNGGLDALQAQLQVQLREYTTADMKGNVVMQMKIQSLIMDLVHERDIVHLLLAERVAKCSNWLWSKQLRYYARPDPGCVVCMVEAEFQYSNEYQGNAPKLVYTPLTDKCYLTLTQAMALGYGGNPYGPAGTGKTESVKALGQCLARQVLVFNCDEQFDYKSMARIFTGLVKCGAWGCFDEFNRLEEDVLSAVSQQIQTIQGALKHQVPKIEFMNNVVEVNGNAGIFVTLNPAGKGYGGRSKLPDNLKALFRSVAMTTPDIELIAEVLLLSEGFKHARDLGKKLVSLFTLSRELLSAQQHYDWGLRALKTVLGIAGKQLVGERGRAAVTPEGERSILLQATRVSTLPKLTFDDVRRFDGLIHDIFPGVELSNFQYEELERAIKEVLQTRGCEVVPEQVEKMLQLHMALAQRMGVIIVGPSGSGKSTLLQVLREAYRVSKVACVPKLHVMNPKAIHRQQLLGHMDMDTREWFDGVLTSAARQVVKEPADQTSWIVCDGDVDPEWIESLNSVLDDNRLLTMPNGERIQFAGNVNFIFECNDLKFASPATVSRCGMIYMSDLSVDVERMLKAWVNRQPEEERARIAGWCDDYFLKAFTWALGNPSVVSTTKAGILFNALSHLEGARSKTEFLRGLARGFGANMAPETRLEFLADITRLTGESNLLRARAGGDAAGPGPGGEVQLVLTQEVLQNLDMLEPWIRRSEPFIVVGPEGCGKSVLLQHAFARVKGASVVTVHCNAQTTAADAMGKVMQACTVATTNAGKVLRPKDGDRLILYFKDLNLPKPDKYMTCQLVQFLQQLITYRGFYDEALEFVGLEKIQIVGSMAPPSSVGRHDLAQRFSAIVRILSVSYSDKDQLTQIYAEVVDQQRAVHAQANPMWRDVDTPKLARAMVEVYDAVRSAFKASEHRHYTFTPRHLTEWALALFRYESDLGIGAVFGYEAARVFRDRLVNREAFNVFDGLLGSVARSYFPAPARDDVYVTGGSAGAGPDGTDNLGPTSLGDFEMLVKGKLLNFEREFKELNMILFPEVLNRIARFNRVLSRPGGSLLLVGRCGVGRRTCLTLSAYMERLELVSPHVTLGYDTAAFRNDLKALLTRTGVEGENTVFFLEDHQIVRPEFLELVNSLLSGGEVPGLFTKEELESLMVPLKDQYAQEGYKHRTLYAFFTARVRRHLHLVLSMDPSNPGFWAKCESNPALFTQCSIQWIDTWSRESMEAFPAIRLQQVFDLSEEDKDGDVIAQIGWIHDSCADLDATPRQYISFVDMYEKIFAAKRDEVLANKHRLQAGLDKLGEAESTVDTLSQRAEKQRVLLKDKQAQADRALQQITVAMQRASGRKREVEAIQGKLAVEERNIQQRRGNVEDELREVQPLIDAAKTAVGQINRDNLNEIRMLRMPPDAIRDVLEGVLRLMGQKDTSWNSIKKFLGQRSVKEEILNFDAHRVTPQIRADVESLLAERASSFEHAVIYRVSVAAAPMASWVKANVKYSMVLEKIAPLEKSLESLTVSLTQSRGELRKCEEDLDLLDQEVVRLKTEFAKVTGEAEALKISLAKAEGTLDSAKSLLDKLSGEKKRWDAQVRSLEFEVRELPLKSVCAAAFLTYLPSQTEVVRARKLQEWAGFLGLEGFRLKYFMSTESDTLHWKREGLPGDDLSMENAIAILEGVTSPLVIDPAAQASAWLKAHLKARVQSLEIITIRDPRFTSLLELAVRFGKTLIVEEVDQIHPILYPLLRKDLSRQGPRWVVQIGDKSIDYNENFKLYLVTRQAQPNIPPDARSLITVANFTTTMSGLESQLLGLTIQHEQPELERQKSHFLKQEEELKLQLAELEETLLKSLATSEGNILENKALLDSLNETKVKANTIAKSLEESKSLQRSLDQQRDAYRPLAERGSRMYFLIAELATINHMYQFSLAVFVKLFQLTLNKRSPTDNVRSRIAVLAKTLVGHVFGHVARALFKADRITFGMYMVQQLEQGVCPPEEWRYFCGQAIQEAPRTAAAPRWIREETVRAFHALHGAFPGLVQQWGLGDSSLWSAWITAPDCEAQFPEALDARLSLFHRLLLVQAFRPDRLQSAMGDFVCRALGIKSVSPPSFSLKELYQEETSGREPVLFITTPGGDPSQELREFAERQVSLERYHQLPMGQGQNEKALDLLRRSARQGHWLCLQNVHLVVAWLPELEKEMYALEPHEDFRLFLTTESHAKFPPSLLKNSLKITFEAPPGLKKNVQRSYDAWSAEYIGSGSGLRAQLLFLLAFFHAIVQERRTYIPRGWSKFYEFSFSDLRSGADIIEYSTKDGRIPQWNFLRGLLQNAIYGGRVDDPYDAVVLRTYLELYFRDEVIGQAGARVKPLPGTRATLPTSNHLPDYAALVQELADPDAPALFSLPANIDRTVQEVNSAHVIAQLKAMVASKSAGAGFDRKRWAAGLAPLLELWDKLAAAHPGLLRAPPARAGAGGGPVGEFVAFERAMGARLVERIHATLGGLARVLRGADTHLPPAALQAGTALLADRVPDAWERAWEGPASAAAYCAAVVRKAAALERWQGLAEAGRLLGTPLDLGHLFRPKTFLNALRQHAAREQRVPMDDLVLATAWDGRAPGPVHMTVTGLQIQGAAFDGARLSPVAADTPAALGLPDATVAFVPGAAQGAAGGAASGGKATLGVPFYTSADRSRLLTGLQVPCAEGRARWVLASVAIVSGDGGE